MKGQEGGGGFTARVREVLGRKGVLPLVGGLAAVILIGILLVAVASGGGDGDGESVTVPPTSAPSDNAGLERSPTTEAATPEPTIDLNRPTGTVRRPETVPGQDAGDRIVIAKAGVNAPITLAVVPPTGGELASPRGADDVVFYDFTNHAGLGGYPGGGGNIIMSGHVDYGRGPCKNGTVPPPCQAVFWDISLLSPGDMVEVRLRGVTHTYRVTGSSDIKADDYEKWDRIWTSTAQESMTLITCGGDFNRTTREYSHRHVVTAVRV
jgi:hypothetical protein